MVQAIPVPCQPIAPVQVKLLFQAILHHPLNTPPLMADHFGTLEWQLHQHPCALAVPKFQNVE
jgi:hypothetical protein